MKNKLWRCFFLGGIGVSFFCIVKKLVGYIIKLADKSCRMETYTIMYDQWFTMRETKGKLEDYLKDNNIHTVGIYGMGNLGIHLLHDFKNISTVQVKYGIDRSVERINESLVIYKPEDFLPEVDLVIVTAIFSYDEIVGNLRAKLTCPIISLKEFMEEI